ncbi:7,8-didemethyl-8-hydroxy-5-deazariboflavin synthase subunit CofG [Moorena sp. SIO3B2]|uniref:7,8-didemethyl-8-hydroxy-5-deazariboflavin synthase subunit CofG n=1 Tax=Moorena sp. SIO3B2 TaxID=2607827 RepID=UPI0013C9671D|nr:7,8-didemethyl-8-hydroxy-5-deazariboflavin synthase subunit CofG [Moorena sp. SIO3B2]NEP34936.1 7,8-didemethyl-8-hydroxy-5-deazariboflavin synthase subunit CofG [Moorena sp. SIO3B2]
MDVSDSQSDSQIITYSPAYTLVPTYECFNRCSYCNFRAEAGSSPWLSVEDAENQLRLLQCQGVCEILILSGEVHPRSSRRKAWFQLIYDLCDLALSLGFLPHTNVGPLSWEEMARLKQVNVSMGLMLEQLTPELLKTVHCYAPSKIPEVRLQQLQWAGELGIPFTTGLLFGIGETEQDWWESLNAIAQIHGEYGHIQEVILQPYSEGTTEIFHSQSFGLNHLVKVIRKARQILPLDITIQIPPNLVDTVGNLPQQSSALLACLEAGARDLGGISPKDEVNPDYPHPHSYRLREVIEPAGWTLVARLPVYPKYDSWLPARLRQVVERWRIGDR